MPPKSTNLSASPMLLKQCRGSGRLDRAAVDRLRLFLVCLGLVTGLLCAGHVSAAEGDSPEIRNAVARGVSYLKTRIDSLQGGHRALVALALYKAGEPADSPELQRTIDEIVGRCKDSKYQSLDGAAGIYAAGVEASLLSDISPKRFRDQLQILAQFLQQNQMETGAWDYPGSSQKAGSMGDTSVTQYACLGLWAISRAGVKIEPQIWVRILNWHTKYQSMDGGFAYCPTANLGPGGSAATLNMSLNAVASLHIAMLHLSPDYLPLQQNVEASVPRVPTKKFGVLEEFKPNPAQAVRAPAIPEDSVKATRKAFAFVVSRYTPLNNESAEFKAYYLYSLERMAALSNVTKLGEHDWYHESAAELMKQQKPDGSWQLGSDSSGRDTAFCLLFLTKATAKNIKRQQPELGFGDGLLAGGRGLPDDLIGVQYDGRNVIAKNQPVPPLDKLLASLQTTGEIDLDQVQANFVEQVQMGDRKQLVGQIDLLKRLAQHPNPETRRTALWALGRSDRLEIGTILIQGLDDPDLGVMIEARNALCWLSRRPNGFGESEDPTRNLPPDATEKQRTDAIAAWHRSVLLNWGNWYLNARPFQDRGDSFEADLRRKMAQLRREDS